MGRSRVREMPAGLVRAQQQFQTWRRSRQARDRIPEPLWALAVKLAKSHGLSPTALALKLDYYSLKKRLEARKSCDRSTPATFVEFSPPPPMPSGECTIEFEDGTGASMRVHLRGYDAPDLVALGRSFWNVE